MKKRRYVSINKKRRYFSILMSLITLFYVFSTVIPTFADENSKEKEEVVYINANPSGSVKNINVVNIFGSGEVKDYGIYSKVKMLSSTAKINQSGDEISFNTKDKKVYYQGTLSDNEIPWNISIKYYLNDKEYSPKDLAGKNGKIKIHLRITKNKNFEGDFFEHYALQTVVKLDTDICENIDSPKATIANVGSIKQLTYTTLPNKELDTTITFDAKKFEMDPININGIKLNLDIDLSENELIGKVNQLVDATKKLNNGSSQLNSKSNELKKGSNSLNSGIASLNKGAYDLDNGIGRLKNGVEGVQDGLNQLNSKSTDLVNGSSQMLNGIQTIQSGLKSRDDFSGKTQELVDGSEKINQGISDLYKGSQEFKEKVGVDSYKSIMKENGADVDLLQQKNSEALAKIDKEIKALKFLLSAIEGKPFTEIKVLEIKKQIESLEEISLLIKGNSATLQGAEKYIDSVSDGADSITNNLRTLNEKYEMFNSQINQIPKIMDTISEKVDKLSNGVDQLADNYKELDNGIKQYTNGVSQLSNGNSQIVQGGSSLSDGSKQLLSGTNSLKKGSDRLGSGIEEYTRGVSKLNDGISKYYNQTSNMESKVKKQIEEIEKSIGGKEVKPVSFVSEKNKNVKSVQFVIKTEQIKKANVKKVEKKEDKPKTFWERFINLFKSK